MGRKGHSWLAWVTGLMLLAGCGEDGGVEPDPAVTRFVGTWDATGYEIWPDLNPDAVIDVLVEFGPFYITVEPSGQYTAVLEASPAPQIQIGQLTVIGGTIRLDPTTPPDEPTATASYAFDGEDYVELDGPTQVDFNDDGTRDPGGSHIEIQRR
jgi:hypothetical protein